MSRGQTVTRCWINGDVIVLPVVLVPNLVSCCAKAWTCLCRQRVIRCWRDVTALPSIFLAAVKNYQLYSLITHVAAHCLYSVRVHSTCLSELGTYHVDVATNESTLCHLSPRCSYKGFSLSTRQSNKLR